MRFSGELIEGHKGVRVVLVPFDPTSEWGEPTRLAGRRHGWPVRGTANGVAFDGYVGERWGRFFIILEGHEVGETIDVAVKPSAKALAHAIEADHPAQGRARYRNARASGRSS